MRRERRRHGEAAACGVGDVDGTGMQMQLVRDGAAGARVGSAIFEIADDGGSQFRQMHADLVGAAGDGFGRDPGEFLARMFHAPRNR